MKRHPDAQSKMDRQISLREALEIICATTPGGHANGHWHGVAVKVARAALFGYQVELWEKDWLTIRQNASPAVRDILPIIPYEEADTPAYARGADSGSVSG